MCLQIFAHVVRSRGSLVLGYSGGGGTGGSAIALSASRPGQRGGSRDPLVRPLDMVTTGRTGRLSRPGR